MANRGPKLVGFTLGGEEHHIPKATALESVERALEGVRQAKTKGPRAREDALNMTPPDDRAKLWFLRGAVMMLEGELRDGTLAQADVHPRIKRISDLLTEWLPELGEQKEGGA